MPGPTPAHLIDLAVQLDRDQRRPAEELRQRDRAIGRELTQFSGGDGDEARDTPGLLAAWLERLPGGRVHRTRSLLNLVWLAVLGLAAAAGWSAAMGVFHYDGARPINVINALAAFVGVQLLLLLLVAILALPGAWARWVPGLAALQHLVRTINPGRLYRLALRYLPSEYREGLARAVGRSAEHQLVFGRAQKWLILTWSQSFALVFNLAAIAGFLQLVLLSDMAFGWTTTLQLTAQTFHGLLAAMAWPWSWLIGTPTLDLVERSRFYRLAAGQEHIADPQQLGAWWTFILGAMVCYGLLPRAVTTTLATVRLRRSVRQAMSWTPGASAVVDRLTTPVVQSTAPSPEPSHDAGEDEAPLAEAVNPAVTVAWAGAGSDEGALPAGGGRTLEEDREAIGQAAAVLEGDDEGRGAVVRVKAWEPPLLELVDFLHDLREAIGPGVAVTVVTLGGTDADRRQWRHKLAAVGDPWLAMAAEPEVMTDE